MFLVKSNYIFKNLQFVRGPLFFLLTFAHETAATPASCSPVSKIAYYVYEKMWKKLMCVIFSFFRHRYYLCLWYTDEV